MTKLLIVYPVLPLVLLLLTPIVAFSTSSVIPTLTDRQAAHVLDDMTTSTHTILGTEKNATRQFHMEKLAGIIENITGYKEDISVSMAGNGLNIRIDPDPDSTSTSGDSSSARLVQDPCSNQPGSARMTFPYENRTDCEVEQWIECIENSETVKWDQLHCDDFKKLFEDPSVPPTPPPSNNTKPPVAGAVLTPTPTPTDRCYAGFAYMIPNYDEVCGTGEDLREDEGEQPLVPLPLNGEGEGEGEQPPVEDQDQGDNSGEDQESEQEAEDDSGEEEASQPREQFGE